MTEHDQPPSSDRADIEALIDRLKPGKLDHYDTLLIEQLPRLLLSLIAIKQNTHTQENGNLHWDRSWQALPRSATWSLVR